MSFDPIKQRRDNISEDCPSHLDLYHSQPAFSQNMYPLRPLSLAMATVMASSVLSLELPKYTGLKTAQNDSILTVTFHNPSSPVNLWNEDTQNDLTDLVSRLQTDNETKVVIFNSDVPRFFVAHLDLTLPALTKRKIPIHTKRRKRISSNGTQLISSNHSPL